MKTSPNDNVFARTVGFG